MDMNHWSSVRLDHILTGNCRLYENDVNLHGLIGVNHLEYNLPLTRGAYHTDLDSKNSCYNKLNITL